MASMGDDDGEIGLQIAPLLDLLFVLLLFFMVTAGSKVQETELGIKIPSHGVSMPGTQQTPITLDIDAQGQVYFNDSPIDTPKSKDMLGLKAKLTEIISKFGDDQPVVIEPNGDTRHERVMDVLNACSAAHVKNIAFGEPSSQS